MSYQSTHMMDADANIAHHTNEHKMETQGAEQIYVT